MKEGLEKAVRSESEQELIKCLDIRQKSNFDPNQFDLIKEALLGTWHSQHEDLINAIYLENLKDGRFTSVGRWMAAMTVFSLRSISDPR